MAESDCEVVLSANLPLGLMIEILSRLPVKPLLRFKCVSKTWLKFLTLDRHFATLHYNQSTQSNPNLSIFAWPCERKDFLLALDYTACDKAIHLDLPFHQGGDNRYSVSGISNGLVCMSNHKDYAQIYVWNPLTKDYITISCLPIPSLRFPGSFNSTVFRFGFDYYSGRYKVMRAFCESQIDEHVYHSQLSVYTIGVDTSWRIIDEDFPHSLSSGCNDVALVSGVLHWLSGKPATPSNYEVIIGFNLKDEVFQETLFPSAIKFDDLSNHQIAELGGYLSVLNTLDGGEIEIWLMGVYGDHKSWSKALTIVKSARNFFVAIEPITITLSGDFIIRLNMQLSLCDTKTKKFTKLKQFGFPIFQIYTYMGSLMSPSIISKMGQV